MKPSIGRIVHVVYPDRKINPVVPAIVTAVHPNSLAVTVFNPEGLPHAAADVRHETDREDDLYFWRWPPRVE